MYWVRVERSKIIPLDSRGAGGLLNKSQGRVRPPYYVPTFGVLPWPIPTFLFPSLSAYLFEPPEARGSSDVSP